jgi:hypothetical protein
MPYHNFAGNKTLVEDTSSEPVPKKFYDSEKI